MHTPLDNIRQEWKGLQQIRFRLEKDYERWDRLVELAKDTFARLHNEIGWDADFEVNDTLPKTRELRLILRHIFPLDEELLGYANDAILSFEQRLSGQLFIWYFFPQKEHFTQQNKPQAIAAGQYRIDQFLQDEHLLLFQVETFLNELKGWVLEVLPEPVEEKA